MSDETPFEVWLIAQQLEAKIHFDAISDTWTGLYLLASTKQVNYALSVLERLILPDEVEKHYLTELAAASVEYCGTLIDKLTREFERQVISVNPQKQFIQRCKLL